MRNLEITVLKCAGAVVLSLPLLDVARITPDAASTFLQLWYCVALFAVAVFGFPKLRGALADELAKAPALVHKVIAFFGRYDGVIWPVYLCAFVISSIISTPFAPGQGVGAFYVVSIFMYAMIATVGGLYAFRAAQKGEPFWSALGKRRDKPEVT